MSTNWIELEYTHLRAEILTLMGIEQAAIRFYVPAAATVYAVPYILKETAQPYLWTVCAVVGGLLALALTQSLYECADGVRRIGSYIMEAIEKDRNCGLRWETVLYQIYRRSRFVPSEKAVISLSLVLGNIAASVAADSCF
jgi:hypothetical protein